MDLEEKRLEAMPPFDASTIAESRRAQKDKAKDELQKAVIGPVHRAREGDRGAGGARGPRAHDRRRAARAERADGVAGLLDPAAENLDAMIDAARKAGQVWPEGGTDGNAPERARLRRAGPRRG